jgi:tetratricopeptide (TPR) repeat protein
MRQDTKFLFCFLILGLFLSLSYAQETAENIEKPIETDLISEKAKESTVRIVGLARKKSDFLLDGGTGFFVAPDKIATSFHVAAGPITVPIFAKLGHKEAIWVIEGVMAFDVKSDIAILKVKSEGIPMPFSDIDTLQIGETVFLAGYPDAEEYKVTEGIVKDVRSSDKLIKMALEVHPGNSGSPVLNSKGEVIGIHVGHSYDAMPSSALKALLAGSTSTEPMEQWQERKIVRAYVYYKQGWKKYNDGNAKEAIKDFDQAIKLNPDDAESYKFRAKVKTGFGDHTGAIEDYNQAIKLNPDDAESYKKRGEAKGQLSDYAGKIDDYSHALKLKSDAVQLKPDDANTYIELGHMKRSIGDHAGAIEAYTAAIKLKPDDVFGYYNRGWAKNHIGDHAGAIEDFTEAIKLKPEYANAYNVRGLAKVALKDYAGAIADYDKAIELNPKYADVYHNRGLAKEALGQHDAAKVDFEKAKEIDPEVGK